MPCPAHPSVAVIGSIIVVIVVVVAVVVLVVVVAWHGRGGGDMA